MCCSADRKMKSEIEIKVKWLDWDGDRRGKIKKPSMVTGNSFKKA